MDIKIFEINLFQGNYYMMPGFFALSLIFAERIISVRGEHVPRGRGADPEIICFFK